MQASLSRVPFGRMQDEVTRLGFGAWAIGSKSYGEVSRETAAATVRAYLEAGGNFLDTARGYAQSESVVGEVLRTEGWRNQVFLCTKVAPVEPEVMRRTFEESLRELGLEQVDLLYLHAPPEEPAEMERALEQMTKFREEGKTRGIGASIKGPNVTADTIELHRQYIRTGVIDAIQLIYSVLRTDARVIFEEAKAAGVALVGRTMLESGFLTGKYGPDHRFAEGDHRQRWTREKWSAIHEAVERLKAIAAETNCASVTELALRFALDEPGLTTLIPGAKNPDQVQQNLRAGLAPNLDPELCSRLRAEFAGLTEVVNPG